MHLHKVQKFQANEIHCWYANFQVCHTKMVTYVDKNQQQDTSRNIIISNQSKSSLSTSPYFAKFQCVPHVFLGRIGLLHLEAPAGQPLRHGQVVALSILQEDQGKVVLLTVDANEGAVTFVLKDGR